MRRSAAKTLLVFAGLGPPIGLVTFSFLAAGLTVHGLLGMLLGIQGLMASYVVGLIPAVVSGGLVAWMRTLRSKYEVLWAALIGTLVGVAYTSCGLMIAAYPAEAIHPNLLILVLTCVVSTLVCWGITRRIDAFRGTPA